MTRKFSCSYCLSVVAAFFVILIALTAQASTSPLFSAAVSYDSGGTFSSAVAVADVNGDGKPDLLVANAGSNTVGVLLGNGDGIFQRGVVYDSGGVKPRSVAVADVNGDGKPDLVVANCSARGLNACNGGGENGVVGVLLGNGDGTFQPAVVYDSGGQGAEFSVAVADVNGDGKLDLVVSNFYCPSLNAGCVGVLLGHGDGTFEPALTSTTETNSCPLAVADLNNDGKPDIAVATCSSFGVGILLGHGDGTFQLPIFAGTDGAAGSIAVADVDLDGKPDIVAADLSSSTVYVILGNGGQGEHGSGGNDTQSVAVADVNGDGKPDIVVVNCAPTGDQCTNLSIGVLGVLLGNGDGTFQAAVGYSSGGTFSSAVAVADVNGDGWPDLAVTTSDGVGLLLNNSAPNATKTAVTTSGSPSFINQAVTFTATVTSTHGVVPDGRTVTFYDGTNLIGTGTTANGTAKFTTSSLKVKTHIIKAIYPGTSIFKPSSGKVTQVVVKYPTTTALSSSLNPSNFGQAVTFTATVTPSGPYAPTGKVKFLDGTTGIGSATLSGGVAKLTKSTLAVGTHPITAQYLGDSFNDKSTSPVLNQVVQ